MLNWKKKNPGNKTPHKEETAAQFHGKQGEKETGAHADAIKGSLFGGAIGDALGYPVEFYSRKQILQKYGPSGVTDYILNRNGIAEISDDTQMTLFTATGILCGAAREKLTGRMEPLESDVWNSYLDWYKMQCGLKISPQERHSWLINVPEMGKDRAPGITCMSALSGGVKGEPYGTIEKPLNNSKGCGGIMRVAPAGLYFNKAPHIRDEMDKVHEHAAKIAALTHGHPLGWLSAAAAAHIINRVVYGGMGVEASATDAIEYFSKHYQSVKFQDELLEIMRKAVQLTKNNRVDDTNIAELGEGWTGEETLAIAIYCSVKYESDFNMAICTSVNHNGDSDSTGAVTGNILGALWGYEQIPKKWKKGMERARGLECAGIILEIAEDLCCQFAVKEDGNDRDGEWFAKYGKNL